MGKKRRTRQQKIIAKLKRQIDEQRAKPVQQSKSKTPDKKKATLSSLKKPENTEKLAFAYAPEMIKKDLIKTLLLSFIFLSVIVILKFTLKI